MFQTFSGSSRRPRQVNLSGQHVNPFGGSSWGAPAASGTQKTVANAQQERQQRQQERERLNATKRIQRTWRGHKSRREVADSRRAEYDSIETETASSTMNVVLVGQAQLLVTFFSPRRRDDIPRLIRWASKVSCLECPDFLGRQQIQPLLVRLATITLEALQVYVLHNLPSDIPQITD